MRKETKEITTNQNISNQRKLTYKEASPKAIPNRLASCSARGHNIQNEPNFTHKAPTKHAKDEDFTHIFPKKIRIITKYCKITQSFTLKKCIFLITFYTLSLLFLLLLLSFLHFSILFVTFSKSWSLTHLTPYTTKTYITFSPQNTHLLINSYSHISIHSFMQNEPNFIRGERRLI